MSDAQLAELARQLHEVTAAVNAAAATARVTLGRGSRVLHEVAAAELRLAAASRALADLRRAGRG